MQIIYALPFIALSVILCAICLVFPRLRRYMVPALVAPVAFGFCSIVGAGTVVLIADKFGLLTEPAMGVRGVVIAMLIYFLPGGLGVWLAVSATRRIQTHFSK